MLPRHSTASEHVSKPSFAETEHPARLSPITNTSTSFLRSGLWAAAMLGLLPVWVLLTWMVFPILAMAAESTSSVGKLRPWPATDAISAAGCEGELCSSWERYEDRPIRHQHREREKKSVDHRKVGCWHRWTGELMAACCPMRPRGRPVVQGTLDPSGAGCLACIWVLNALCAAV